MLLVTGLILLPVILDRFVLKTKVIFTRHVLRVSGMLMLITLVFDNVLSALPVYIFEREKTLGIYLPYAPLEDLFYIVGIVFFVAVVDAKLGGKSRSDSGHKSNEIES